MMRLVLVGLLALFLATAAHKSSDADSNPLSAQYLAKSTFIFLADFKTQDPNNLLFAYLPAGTRFIAFDRTQTINGSPRRLVLTEDGIWGYIKDAPEHYWNVMQSGLLKAEPITVVIQDQIVKTVDISSGVSLVITLTPSELYRLSTEDDETYSVRIDNSKLGMLAPEISYIVQIPRSKAVLYDRTMPLSRGEISPFEEGWLDDVREIRKECDTKEVRSYGIKGRLGLDVTKWFINLGAGLEGEVTKIEEYGPDINVRQSYFRRHASDSTNQGLYVVTRKQECKGDAKIAFTIRDPAGTEQVIDEEFAKQRQLFHDPLSGQLLVTCREQFFAIRAALLDVGYNMIDTSFFISRIARFRDFASGACSK